MSDIVYTKTKIDALRAQDAAAYAPASATTLSGLAAVDRAFVSREAFVAALGSDATLGATIAADGRDVHFGSYWAAGPRVNLRYQIVSTDPTGDVTKIALGASKWLTQVFDGDTADVRQFGSRCDGGAHDDLPATQAAVDWALTNSVGAINVRTVRFPAASYYHSGPVIVGNSTSGAYTRASFVGVGGMGSVKFVSTSSNSPHWSLTASLMWGMTWRNIGYTWSTPTDATKTGRVAFHLGTGNGSFFNSRIEGGLFDSGHYFADTAGMLWWGVWVSDFTLAGNVTGGLYSLTGSAGQPNNSFERIYISAGAMVGPIFNANSMDVEYRNVEINSGALGPRILEDGGGGSHTFDTLRFESYTYTVGKDLIYIPNTQLTARKAYFAGGTIGAGIHVNLIGGGNNPRGYIHIDEIDISPLTIGTGSFVTVYSGGGSADVTSQQNDVRIGNVRTTTLTWNSNLMLTDTGSSVSSDAVYVTGWDNPGRTQFWGNADVTVTQYTPRVNVFLTALTADRVVHLPEGSQDGGMWSGRRFEFYKPVTGTGALIVMSSGTEVGRIAAGQVGHVTVVWNRGQPNGNAGRTWALIDKQAA